MLGIGEGESAVDLQGGAGAAAKVPALLTDIGGNPAGFTWPAADLPARRPDSLPLGSLDVATNGSQPAIEQARTVLKNAYPTGTGSPPPQTLGESSAVGKAADKPPLAVPPAAAPPGQHFACAEDG